MFENRQMLVKKENLKCFIHNECSYNTMYIRVCQVLQMGSTCAQGWNIFRIRMILICGMEHGLGMNLIYLDSIGGQTLC